jgi:RNA polymerase sigma-70 factor (ECF subfamily)
LEDIELIRRVKGGDSEAFSLLVARYQRPILGFVHGLVRDSSMVEDLGQEIFFSAYRSMGNFDERRGVPFSAWLFEIARNCCLSFLRKTRRMRTVPLDESPEPGDRGKGADDVLEAREQERIIRKSLDRVPEPFRGTLMKSLSGLTLAEIAGAEKIPPATVKTRLFRARQALRKIMRKLPGGKADERV